MLKRFIFDIETNGLLDTMDTIHCVVLLDIDTGIYHSYPPKKVPEAIELLAAADWICGHNIIDFDIPAIQIVYPDFIPMGKINDTIVMSRLIKADVLTEDAIKNKLPKRLWGSQSLKAWGLRLGVHKGDFETDWKKYSKEMLEYCVQDVEVNLSLHLELENSGFSEMSIDLNHEIAMVCQRISNKGWTFNEKAAGSLYAKLSKRRGELEEELVTLFPPWTVETEFIPKANNKSRGYIKGEPFIKTKEVEFNPNSRAHIHRSLVDKYGWKPKAYSAGGVATIDESILSKLHYPEAKKLEEFFTIQKRIGQVAEGKNAWLKLVDKHGILRHRIIPGSTISGRASHRSPNLAQVPRASAPYGKECRELFRAPKGWMMVGSDLSGIELRILASYLYPYDDGIYANQILSGDIHTYNQKSFGAKTRDQAKTLIYAMIYGGGDKLIGEIVGGSSKDGKKLKKNYDQSVPAFAQLKRQLNSAAQRGYLNGLCGRRLYLRSPHRQLSQLLQSGAASICAKWVALVNAELEDTLEGQAYIMGWVHDEIEIAVKDKETAEYVGNITGRAAKKAGEFFKTRIGIASEYSVGTTWADTH
jgi:hypothetical protein